MFHKRPGADIAVAFALVSSLASAASAHSIWIDRTSEGLVASFGEIEEGKGDTLRPEHAWHLVRTACGTGGAAPSVRLGTDRVLLEGTCPSPLLVHGGMPVHGKGGDAGRAIFVARHFADSGRAVAIDSSLGLDIVPVPGSNGAIRVLMSGTPLPGHKVSVLGPAKAKLEFVADSEGVVRLARPRRGRGRSPRTSRKLARARTAVRNTPGSGTSPPSPSSDADMVAFLLAGLLFGVEGPFDTAAVEGTPVPERRPDAPVATGSDPSVHVDPEPTVTDSVSLSTDEPANPKGIGTDGPIRVLPSTVVRGKRRGREIEESGYSVDVIGTREAGSRSGDVQDLVAATSGVVVREEGGLGSGSELSLNGMSGRHVRIFLDGVPIEQLGTGLQLGDLPPNAVRSIEVYKGVVPIHLGADALGGAIDVRTLPDPRTFLDASWSWGSFNTQRGSFNGLWRADSLPVAVRINAYHNRSDNDYRIDWKLTDPETGKYGPERSFRRFHDGYSSTWGSAEAGLVGADFADQLWLGASAGRTDKEIQHGNSLDRVFGEVERRSESVQATARWEKEGILLPGISARAWASIGTATTELVDTSSLQYDWTGVGRPRNSSNGNGEALWYKTFYRLEEDTRTGFADLRWSIAEANHLEASWTGIGYSSRWRDLFERERFPPSTIAKHVAGLSYRRDLFDRNLSVTVFGKSYDQNATVQTMSSYANETGALVEKDVSESGYGAAISWKPTGGLLLKTSLEDAVRLQEAAELLGDGLLLKSNPDLRPERSFNMNAGLQAEFRAEDHLFRGEIGGFRRDVVDKVRLNSEGATSRYENVGRVLVVGAEGDASWSGWRVVEVGLNGTWQRSRDRTPGAVTYGVQLPNIPILFGNGRVSATWTRPWGRDATLRANWEIHHVREYFLYWPVFGDAETKHRIPSQWTQSAGVVLGVLDDRLSWSVDCSNLTDAKTYDDWRKQKPGRTWATKVRVSL